jgi:hypothetical protein
VGVDEDSLTFFELEELFVGKGGIPLNGAVYFELGLNE